MKKKPPLPPADTPAGPGRPTEAQKGTPQHGNFERPPIEPAAESAADYRAAGGNMFNLRNEQTTL